MDRARRAEPYSNATIWTREIARNLAGHLARISKAHSYVDTTSPKTRLLPKFQHHHHVKRCATSPTKARLPLSDELDPSNTSIDTGGDVDNNNAHELEGRPDGNEIETPSPHHTQSARNDSGRQSGRTLQPLKHARKAVRKKSRHDGSKKAKMEADRLETIALENQRIQERLAKIATPSTKHSVHSHSHSLTPVLMRPSSSSSGLHSADGSMREAFDKTQPKQPLHDYNKKQEQLKIWTENQALAKRLRTAKTTLKPKEWEKDDKRNQQFLKSQEKRRIALQQELFRAQLSPQSLLARTPKYSNQHQHEPGGRTGSPSLSSPSARSTTRASERTEGNNTKLHPSDADSSRASAANHRRIMMLRNQRSAPSSDHHSASMTELRYQLDKDKLLDAPEHDTDVVSVRFTFSRNQSRGRLCPDTGVDTSALALDSTTLSEQRHRHTDSLFALGAFSPAVELESALDAMASETEADEQTAIRPECLDVEAVTDDEINAVVFETLQDSIDQIADALVSSQYQALADDAFAGQVDGLQEPLQDAKDALQDALVSEVAPDEHATEPTSAPALSPVSSVVEAQQQDSDASSSPDTSHALPIEAALERISSVIAFEDSEKEATDHDSTGEFDHPPADEDTAVSVLTFEPVTASAIDDSSRSERDDRSYGDDDQEFEADDVSHGAASTPVVAAPTEADASESAGRDAKKSEDAHDDNDTHDDESGYGSEFDDEAEPPSPLGAAVMPSHRTEEVDAPGDVVREPSENHVDGAGEAEADADDDNENYEDHYDDDSENATPAHAHDEDTDEGAASYSDDNFSDGEDKEFDS